MVMMMIDADYKSLFVCYGLLLVSHYACSIPFRVPKYPLLAAM